MTEKRFIVLDDGLDLLIKDIITGDTFSDAESVVDVLNELNDRIEQLENKNKHLRSSIKRLADMTDDFQSMAHELDEENTRLKVLLHKKRTCSACKNLSVIVSERSDYWCSCKDEYMNLEDFYDDCESYKMDKLSLREKEHKVWD